MKVKRDTSFSQKLQAGWTKDELMKYYGLIEMQYKKVIESLKAVREVA